MVIALKQKNLNILMTHDLYNVNACANPILLPDALSNKSFHGQGFTGEKQHSIVRVTYRFTRLNDVGLVLISITNACDNIESTQKYDTTN